MARAKIDLPKSFQFQTDIPVRISDINYGGHLGNDAMLTLLQEARVQLLQHHGWNEMNIDGASIIMSDAVVIYKSEAFYGDVLVVEIAIAEIVGAGCDVLYRVTNKASGKEVARAKTGIVFFDYSARKIIGVPNAFRKRFETARVDETNSQDTR